MKTAGPSFLHLKSSFGLFSLLNVDLSPSSAPPKQHLILYGRGAGAGMVHLGDGAMFQEVNEFFVSYALSSYVAFECSDCIQDAAQ